MHRQRQQYGQEEQTQRLKRGKARDEQRLAHQRKRANGSEPHDPHRDQDHEVVQADPELLQGVAGRPVQPRHEIPKHDPDKYQRQQLNL